jgi:hypothetical protein
MHGEALFPTPKNLSKNQPVQTNTETEQRKRIKKRAFEGIPMSDSDVSVPETAIPATIRSVPTFPETTVIRLSDLSNIAVASSETSFVKLPVWTTGRCEPPAIP